MIGMLIGIAALSAWGLYRFQQLLAQQPKVKGNPLDIAERIAHNYRTAYALEYGEIFTITSIVCVIGAVLALFISSRREHADDTQGETREEVVSHD